MVSLFESPPTFTLELVPEPILLPREREDTAVQERGREQERPECPPKFSGCVE